MSRVLLLLLLVDQVFADSQCFGETHHGKIQDSVRLPQSGANYKAYSDVGWHLGRTHVHDRVAAVLLKSWQRLTKESPDDRFMYAETGWPEGGHFPPHKTHQNGLSVDVMVPVVDAEGKADWLPVSWFNRWGYDIDFSETGIYQLWRLDFEALQRFLLAVLAESQSEGIKIRRVIFDPRLQPLLLRGENGEFLKEHMVFNTKQAWVRHDEHIHIDFQLPCSPMTTG